MGLYEWRLRISLAAQVDNATRRQQSFRTARQWRRVRQWLAETPVMGTLRLPLHVPAVAGKRTRPPSTLC